ncbi:MAG: porin family protein [Pseudomonadales bacterium]|nr:porin family protein [Pseudomonadales bacterium]
MKKLLLMITSAAAISSPAAMAYEPRSNDHGLYLGANYGYLKIESADDFDDDSDALQGVIGYRLNNYLAIEGSYIDFGDYGKNGAKASTDGYTVAVKGMFPFTEHFGVYVKLGQLWWETSYDILAFQGSTEDEGLFYGAGVSFGVTDSLLLNAEYVVYDHELEASNVTSSSNFDTDLEHASVGLEYRF